MHSATLVSIVLAQADPAAPGFDWLDAVPWAALIAAIAALAVAIGKQVGEARNRRRDVYGEAYKAAREWIEAVYRVRRRSKPADPDLVNRFHDLQERISYFEGWLGSESAALANAYCHMVRTIKSITHQPLNKAWTEPLRTPESWTQESDVHPDDDPALAEASQQFLRAVRWHLSLWLFPRVWLAFRWRFLPWLNERRRRGPGASGMTDDNDADNDTGK